MDKQRPDVVPIPALSDNYIWAVLPTQSNHCVIVDPGEATPVLDFLQAHNRTLSAILITHHHYDHTQGIQTVLSHYPNTPVYGPALEHVDGVTVALQDGDTVSLPACGLTFLVRHIPGHTLGHIAFIGHGMAFTGDTLFTAGAGKIFEGTPEQMAQSLATLAALPEDTLIYCGHEYTEHNLAFAKAVEPKNVDIDQRLMQVQARRAKQLPTVPAPLSVELRTNPFLRTRQDSVITAAEQYANTALTNSVQVLMTIREWKNSGF